MPISETEKHRLLKAFDTSYMPVQLSQVWVDEDTHEVNVVAYSIRLLAKKTIPFKMGHVHGHYYCDKCDLESLHNAPHTVTHDFICSANLLTSLEGGPTSVGTHSSQGGIYGCAVNLLNNFVGAPTTFTGHFAGSQQLGGALTSVDGIPPHSTKVTITAHAKLPLLKLTQYPLVDLKYPHVGGTNEKLTQIINRHAGQGKAGALKAAAELIKYGFKDNARW